MNTRQQLRQQLRQARRSLSQQQQQQAARQLCSRLKRLPTIITAQHVAIYLPNDGEIDPTPFIRWCWQMGKQTYLPVLNPLAENRLWFLPYHHNTTLIKNRYGIAEPTRHNGQQTMPAHKLDLVLLPLVGFDKSGGRLGMGGGYYDRTFGYTQRFAGQKPKRLGLAHSLQEVNQLPVESWDIALEGIVTDTGTYPCIHQP